MVFIKIYIPSYQIIYNITINYLKILKKNQVADQMSNTKILIAEDDGIVSLDIKSVLESFGYEVPFVVSTGEDVIKKAEKFHPDLILMDISLKGNIDGIEAASKIKKMDIPIIFLTAYKNSSLIERTQDSEPYGYLLKPYDVTELKLNIEIALKKHEKIKNLEEIINRTPLPLFFIDDQHKVVYWNQSMEQFSGTSYDEVIGTDNHWKVFYNEKRPCMADLLVDNQINLLSELYSGEVSRSEIDSYSVEEFFPNLNTNGKYLNFRASIIKNIKGTTIGAIEIIDNK